MATGSVMKFRGVGNFLSRYLTIHNIVAPQSRSGVSSWRYAIHSRTGISFLRSRPFTIVSALSWKVEDLNESGG